MTLAASRLISATTLQLKTVAKMMSVIKLPHTTAAHQDNRELEDHRNSENLKGHSKMMLQKL